MNHAYETATFAGGCFWCIEDAFEHQPGVVSAVSGYAGGIGSNPTYEQVSAGETSHVEAVQIVFDPSITNYGALIEHFWQQIDPLDPNGQFADQGSQYRTVIFYHDKLQKQIAEESKVRLAKLNQYKKPIATQIKPFTTFYLAEDYHQHYSQKNASHYRQYKQGSGRADFIKQEWGE